MEWTSLSFVIVCLCSSFWQNVERRLLGRVVETGRLGGGGGGEGSNKRRLLVRTYSQENIEVTARYMSVHPPRLLVFDGQEFGLYNLEHKSNHYHNHPECGRCAKLVPLLVEALVSQFPLRFRNNAPPFQLLLTEGDSIHTDCVNSINNRRTCPTQDFAPLLAFSSVPRDSTILPTVQAFPNWFYLQCLYEWRIHQQTNQSCNWKEFNQDVLSSSLTTTLWNDLIPSIVWRGSDFPFLPYMTQFRHMKGGARFFQQQLNDKKEKEESSSSSSPQQALDHLLHHWDDLTPRWRSVALSLQARLETTNNTTNSVAWLDSKFHENKALPFQVMEMEHRFNKMVGLEVSESRFMETSELGRYRYQLDLGGGGGTSWRGTLTKLALPGLLFHHETPTMDWFYQDDLFQPHVHYLPVQWDLSDLRLRYNWAQAHPHQAQAMARNATHLAHYLLSPTYMKQVYNELYRIYLPQTVSAYRPSDNDDQQQETWASIQERYQRNGFKLRRVSHCQACSCTTETHPDTHVTQEWCIPGQTHS